ncbi:hypothetical protein [Arthrobacter sp. ISL-72]|nr:hypothetical protein [Arthrobacter sp. ISL-72]
MTVLLEAGIREDIVDEDRHAGLQCFGAGPLSLTLGQAGDQTVQ